MVDADSQTRQARLAELKRQIAADTYETHEKLEAAIDAFLDGRPMSVARPEQQRPNRPK